MPTLNPTLFPACAARFSNRVEHWAQAVHSNHRHRCSCHRCRHIITTNTHFAVDKLGEIDDEVLSLPVPKLKLKMPSRLTDFTNICVDARRIDAQIKMPLREEKGIWQGTYVETILSLLSLTSYTIVFACGQLAQNEGETKVQTETPLRGSTFQRVPEGNRISMSSFLLRGDRPRS